MKFIMAYCLLCGASAPEGYPPESPGGMNGCKDPVIYWTPVPDKPKDE